MDSALMFILAVITLTVGTLLWKVGPSNIKDFFKTRGGKGILKGIVLAVTFSLLFAGVGLLSGCVNHASVYAGLEDTKQNSPMCSDRKGDQVTSNIGLKANLFESKDKRFATNVKYTHHSCAFADDGESYDALGVELEYKFYEK